MPVCIIITRCGGSACRVGTVELAQGEQYVAPLLDLPLAGVLITLANEAELFARASDMTCIPTTAHAHSLNGVQLFVVLAADISNAVVDIWSKRCTALGAVVHRIVRATAPLATRGKRPRSPQLPDMESMSVQSRVLIVDTALSPRDVMLRLGDAVVHSGDYDDAAALEQLRATFGEMHTPAWVVACLNDHARVSANEHVWPRPGHSIAVHSAHTTTAAPMHPAASAAAKPHVLPPVVSETTVPDAGDISIWGADSTAATYIACPFSYDVIMKHAASVLRLYPWLVLDVLPVAGEADLTSERDAHDAMQALQSYAETDGSLQGAQDDSGGINAHVTAWLEPLLDAYRVSGSDAGLHKRKAMERTIAVVARWPFRLSTAADVDALPVGKESKAKVLEIVSTGRLARVDEYLHNDTLVARMALRKVYASSADATRKWVAAGAKTPADLLRLHTSGAIKLTPTQVVGVQYYDAMQQRIPRDQCSEFLRVVAALAARLFPGCLCTLGGSYRRGAATSSDFDVIIGLPPGAHDWPELSLMRVYRALRADSCIVADLTSAPACIEDELAPTGEPWEIPTVRWRGICIPAVYGVGDGTPRRIDVQCFTAAQMPYALLSWTGNVFLNRAVRMYANFLGFDLDDASMLPSHRKRLMKELLHRPSSGTVTVRPCPVDVIPRCRCERDVFAFLGLRYIPPESRNFFAQPSDGAHDAAAAAAATQLDV